MIVDVAVPLRVAKSFHYAIDQDQADGLGPGSVVQVPFRKKEVHAFVLGFPDETDVPLDRLRAIDKVLVKEPLLGDQMLDFCRWISEYYCHPLGETLATAIPRDAWKFSDKKRRKDPFQVSSEESSEKPELTPDQEKALQTILGSTEEKPFLLHGVTGSGKTEVYLRLMEQMLSEGKGAIVLTPEISLTPQLIGRFASRFPGQIAVLHSDLSPRERFDQWQLIRSGSARIVVGARSAVFAPVQNLSLIVVDEEHETSFKQEDGLRYHARDLAVVRGKYFGAKVVLGSATPSLESYTNAKKEKYEIVSLPKRVSQQGLPSIEIVNLQDEPRSDSEGSKWLSETLKNEISLTLENKQQVLLYLNRLGFAYFLSCEDCGHTWHCRSCDVSMTYYRSPPHLQCHYCGGKLPPPQTCTECRGTHVRPVGIGTEQLESDLRTAFPEARVARFDRSVIRTRKNLESILKQISEREIDIVVGTQMIAKGHDYPGIALVGVILADASLNLPDFRAHEKTFQVLTQVAGRAGRAEHPGRVLIQTYQPEHPAIVAAAEQKLESFYDAELSQRQQLGFPPAVRMAVLKFQHRNEATVGKFAQRTRLFLEKRYGANPQLALLGPSPSGISRVKELYRWQLLIKSPSVQFIHQVIRESQGYLAAQKTAVQSYVDIDPLSFM